MANYIYVSRTFLGGDRNLILAALSMALNIPDIAIAAINVDRLSKFVKA